MKKSEKYNILSDIAHMSDTELETKAYEAIYDCLGSQAEIMIDQDWNVEDIIERKKYEKFLSEKSDLYMKCCDKRGIELFNKGV